MKRVFTVFLTIIIILTLSTPIALASNDKLIIDNINIYEGMNSSYSKGYSPIIEKDKAVIILPLIYDGSKKIVGDKIMVTPDLGDTVDSPFSYSNYQMDVSLANNGVNGGKSEVSSFLVRVEIPLAYNRINGTYPIIINTSFTTESTEIIEPIEQSFTVYLTITDGKNPNEPEHIPESIPETEPEPRPQPKVIINKYEVNPETIIAGDPFDVRLSLKNMEKKWSAMNIKLTYRGEAEDILPASKTNTLFIDKIPKESTHELTLHMKARIEAEAKPQKILLTMEYEDSAGTPYTVNEEILVEFKQPIRLEMDEVTIPSTVNAGDSLPITTNIFNMGRSTLYNVRCSLEIPGVIPDGSAYLGNMEPGTTENVEIYVFFGTLDMGGKVHSDSEEETKDNEKSDEDIPKNEDTGKYGRTEGIMTITYEDEYGEVYTETLDISTTIEKPVFSNDNNIGQEPEEKPDRASQWWVSIALGAGVGMILFGRISYKKKMNKLKMEYSDEDI